MLYWDPYDQARVCAHTCPSFHLFRSDCSLLGAESKVGYGGQIPCSHFIDFGDLPLSTPLAKRNKQTTHASHMFRLFLFCVPYLGGWVV